MANTLHYINDTAFLILNLLDSNGDKITNLSEFDDIEFWLQNEDGRVTRKEWSISEGTAKITATDDQVEMVIEAGDLQGAAVRDITLFARYHFTKTGTEFGDVPLQKSIGYNLFKLLTHAKSYE